MQPTAEQFTEKAWAAILSAQNLAQKRRHQQLETEHLLLALLEQDGLANRILEKAGVSPTTLQDSVESHLSQQPSLQTPPESVYLGSGLNGLLDRAETLKQAYGDSYISIEHLLLALAEDSRCGKRLLSQAGASPKTLKTAIDAVRGSQTVTDQNPEGTLSLIHI